jgi:hypothetical protein
MAFKMTIMIAFLNELLTFAVSPLNRSSGEIDESLRCSCTMKKAYFSPKKAILLLGTKLCRLDGDSKQIQSDLL